MKKQKRSWWQNWWIQYYAKKAFYHKQVALYNLYRHNEAVDNYESKKSHRDKNKPVDNDTFQGYYIADESADLYATNYNENWSLYMKYKQKLDVILEMTQEPPAVRLAE